MYKEAFGYTLSEHAEGECVTHAHTSERDTERERERECVCVPAQSSPLQHQHWTDLDCDPPGPDMTGGGEEGSGEPGEGAVREPGTAYCTALYSQACLPSSSSGESQAK